MERVSKLSRRSVTGPELYRMCMIKDIEGIRACWPLPTTSINYKNGIFEYTSLCKIAGYGKRYEICKLLLACPGIDINAQSHIGFSALMYTIEPRNLGIFILLMARPEVNVNLQTESGYTALSIAANWGRLNYVRLLLARRDIDPNLHTKDGQTVLETIIARKYPNLNIVRLLLARGAHVCKQNPSYGDAVNELLRVWKTGPPRWTRFGGYKYYPVAFDLVALCWLLCCKRLGVFPKDIRYLMIEYIARGWVK